MKWLLLSIILGHVQACGRARGDENRDPCQLDKGTPPPDYGYPKDSILRLNHLQAPGSHNSFHIAPAKPISGEHRYTHTPLDDGLERLGLRQLELDIHWDRISNKYTVFHIPGLDELSTCHFLTDCLQVVRTWSLENPGHQPIFIFIEPKDFLDAYPITDYDLLDAEIRSVWPEDRILTPDRLQVDYLSVHERITSEGWPTLGELRDHVLFTLLDTEVHYSGYTHGNTSLKCRVMFVDGKTNLDSPFAAIIKLVNPLESTRMIQDALSRQFIVGSNVDNATATDVDNAARLNAALTLGVHLLSSDFPEPVVGRTYSLVLPEGTPSRCNPQTAPGGCVSPDIENLP